MSEGAFLSVGAASVVSGVVCLPRTGAWTATLALDSASAPTGKVTLTFLGGGRLEGYVKRGGVAADTVTLKVVGGGGGLSKQVPAKYYRSVPLRLPFQDVLREAGERLSDTSDGLLLSRTTKAYARMAGPAGECLAVLVRAADSTWRVLPDGSIRVGPDSYAPSRAEYQLLELYPEARKLLLSLEPGALLLPGAAIAEGRVSYVELHVGTTLRAHVWLEE